MNIIVATHWSLFIAEGEQVKHVLSTKEYGHYGVTWNENYLFAVYMDRTRLDGQNQWIQRFDHELRPCGKILDNRIAGAHQILWHDGRLWVCSTNTDEIVSCREDGSDERRWCYHDRPPGEDHVNSIWFDEDHMYLLAHGYRWGIPAIHVFSYPDLLSHEIVANFSQAHNIYVHKGAFVVNGRGMLRYGDRVFRFGTDTAMHIGLAATEDKFLIGSSLFIKDRKERRSDQAGGIIKIDASGPGPGWTYCEYDLGPVSEIRILDEPDLAHNGILWRGKYGVA